MDAVYTLWTRRGAWRMNGSRRESQFDETETFGMQKCDFAAARIAAHGGLQSIAYIQAIMSLSRDGAHQVKRREKVRQEDAVAPGLSRNVPKRVYELAHHVQ